MLLLTLAGAVALPANAATGVRLGRLDNGMDVVLVENHSVPMIAANIIVKAGARDETWQTWGAAHFLEHLLFNGTRNRTQEEIYAAFDRIGAYHNAHTGSHFTDFMVLIGREDFATGFDVLAEMVFESTLPAHKVEKERGIVMEEIARSQSGNDGAEGTLDELLYGHTSLAREVLGTTESIARLDRDSVWAFYRRWYQPNNALLFATGDFSADSLLHWFQTRLKRYPPAELPPRQTLKAPDFGAFAGLGVVSRSAPVKQRTITIALAAPRPGSRDFVPLMMQLRALDRRFEAALPPGVRGSTELALDPDLGVIKVSLSAPKDGPGTSELLGLVDKELTRLVEKAPDAGEMATLSRSYLAEQVYNTERLHYYGMMYATYWALVPWDEFTSWNDRLAETTTEELKGAATRWLLTPERLTLTVEPEAAVGTKSDSAGAHVSRLQPDGGPLVIARSDPTASVFAIHVLAMDRWLWDRVYGVGAVDLLHRTLGEAASAGQKIGDRLDGLAANVKTADDSSIPYDDYYTAPDFSFVRLEILPDQWRAGVDLLAELLESTPLTDPLVLAAKERADAGRTAQGKSPVGAGSGRLHELLVSGTPLAASVYGDVKTVTTADLERLRKGYLHPENLIVTIAGPVPAASAADAVVKGFTSRIKGKLERPADWSDKIRPLRVVTTGRDSLALERPQGAVVMGEVIKGVSPEERAALTVANAYFSERMGSVLRESRGLAYSLGSSLNFQRGDEGKLWGLWEISIATRPEKLAEAEVGIRELLDELQQHTFTAEEIERITAAIIGRLLMRDMARIGQAYAMGVGEFYWGDPDSRAHLIEQLKGITSDAVKAAATNFLEPKRLAVVIVR